MFVISYLTEAYNICFVPIKFNMMLLSDEVDKQETVYLVKLCLFIPNIIPAYKGMGFVALDLHCHIQAYGPLVTISSHVTNVHITQPTLQQVYN